MSSTHKGLAAFCIPLLTLLILFTGCEAPGSVGGDFVDKSELTFDTLSISNIQPQSYNGYTGRLTFVTMGNYSDPVFGDIEARALLKPTRSTSMPEGELLDSDEYSMQLQLVMDSLSTSGDTLSPANYSVYEVTSQWNGSTFRLDSELSYNETNLVGSFSITNEDTVTVDLSDEWKNTFAGYLQNDAPDADSVYQYEFRGLALVADDGAGKLSFPRMASSRFLAINTEDPDTTNFSVRDWAYNLNRTGETTQSDVSALHNTVEGMLLLNIEGLIEEFEDNNLIRAEIVFYEAIDELEGLPANHVRRTVNSIGMDIGVEEDPAYDFQFGALEATGSRNSSDGSFRINITNYINNTIYGTEDRTDLYIGIGSNTGDLKSALIYNQNAPENLLPKLIITSLTDDEE
ncbi:MAG: hypothetical protein WD016_10545 [Balneolaceae bacterium]